jgi:hypothetical protein
MSAKNLRGGQAHVVNGRQIIWIDRHPTESDEDCAPERISDRENGLYRNRDLDIPIDNEEHWDAENESEIELDNTVEDTETPAQRHVRAALNVPELIRHTRRSKKKVEKVIMLVNTIETGRNNGIKKM